MDRNHSSSPVESSRASIGHAGGEVAPPTRDISGLIAKRDSAFMNEASSNVQNDQNVVTSATAEPAATESVVAEAMNEPQLVANETIPLPESMPASETAENVSTGLTGETTAVVVHEADLARSQTLSNLGSEASESLAIPPAAFANPVEVEPVVGEVELAGAVPEKPNEVIVNDSVVAPIAMEPLESVAETPRMIEEAGQDQPNRATDSKADPDQVMSLAPEPEQTKDGAAEPLDDAESAVEKNLLIDDSFDDNNYAKSRSASSSGQLTDATAPFAHINNTAATATASVVVGTAKRSRFMLIFLLVVFVLITAATIVVLFFKDHLPPEILKLVNLF